ncbi:MAG: hypothetical protein AAFX65_02065 [Cyanobacteria bacterium J06638_7]
MSFIVGFHRSGTSLLTSVVQHLLIGNGSVPFTFMPPAADNPEGFYESIELFRLNNNILQCVGHKWECPWLLTPQIDEVMSRLDQETVNVFLDSHPVPYNAVWIDKDPRLCLTIDFVHRILNVKLPLLAIIRNPILTAQSLRKRNGFSLPHALGMWIIYNYHAFIGNSSLPLALISFEDLVAAPDQVAGTIAEFINGTILQERDETVRGCASIEQIDSSTVLGAIREHTNSQLVHAMPEEHFDVTHVLATAAWAMWQAILAQKNSSYDLTPDIRTTGAIALCAVLDYSARHYPSPFYSYNLDLAAKLEKSKTLAQARDQAFRDARLRWKAALGELKNDVQVLRSEQSYLQDQLTESVNVIRNLQNEVLEQIVIRTTLGDKLSQVQSELHSLRQQLRERALEVYSLSTQLMEQGRRMQAMAGKLDWNRRSLLLMRALFSQSEKNVKHLKNLLSRVLAPAGGIDAILAQKRNGHSRR